MVERAVVPADVAGEEESRRVGSASRISTSIMFEPRRWPGVVVPHVDRFGRREPVAAFDDLKEFERSLDIFAVVERQRRLVLRVCPLRLAYSASRSWFLAESRRINSASSCVAGVQ